MKEGEDKGPHDDAESRAEEVVPEPDLRNTHAEIHRCEGKIDKTEIEHCGKTVSLDGVVIFLSACPPIRDAANSLPRVRPMTKAPLCEPSHGPDPHIDKAPVRPEKRRAQPGHEGSRHKQAHPDGIDQHESDWRPDARPLQKPPKGIFRKKVLYRREPHHIEGCNNESEKGEGFQNARLAAFFRCWTLSFFHFPSPYVLNSGADGVSSTEPCAGITALPAKSS
jgi:hypothetical protein